MVDMEITVDLSAVQERKEEWIRNGYLWDDVHNAPVHHVVMHLLLQARKMPMPAGIEIHHIDHNKHNNHPSNLILVPPIVHVIIHMCTRRWEGHEAIGDLRKPEHLLDFLVRARIAYLYAGSLVGRATNNHNTTEGETNA